MRYDFDVNKLVEQYLSVFFRKPKMLAFLFALFKPITSLKNTFLGFIVLAKREVLQNGQMIRLEVLLNDLYDAVLRRITITDTSGVFLVLSNANATVLSNNTSLVIADEVDYDQTVDFVVKVFGGGQGNIFVLSNANATILSDDNAVSISNSNSNPLSNQIANTVRRYKIAGKSFKIQSI